jgi:bifunctional non-homologous end joining protein LigD
VPRRSEDWLKFKCGQRQELVIGGFTNPAGSRTGFGALLVGYYEGDRLRYADKVGTGYDRRTLRELRKRLDDLERADQPFAGDRLRERGTHCVRPELVAEIAFSEWTGDGRLRHPRFIGLRTDKTAGDVARECRREAGGAALRKGAFSTSGPCRGRCCGADLGIAVQGIEVAGLGEVTAGLQPR